MKFLYDMMFVLILTFPLLGVINSFMMNDNFQLQKKINNAVFLSLIFVNIVAFILYYSFGVDVINLFTISRNIPIVFSLNSINLSFSLFISFIIFFLNYFFQNSFKSFDMGDKYILYNKQIACLYLLYMLICFSHDMVISILLYTLILIYSYFLITNPDLMEFRKDYSITLTISFIFNILFICIMGFYYMYNGSNLFVFQDINRLQNIDMYWLFVILFLLILVNLSGPIYLIFKEKFYYEDLLPMLVILIFPFVVINTFLFTKVIYYVFYNNISNVGLYFYYAGFFVIIIFLLLLVLNIFFIKNGVKFILLFGFINFITFFSQFLFLNTEQELTKLFVNFLFLVLAISFSIFSYMQILHEMFRYETTNHGSIYHIKKLKVIFYFIMLFLPIFVNIFSFMGLDFYNFNILYFINMIEILILLILYISHIVMFLRKNGGRKEVAKVKKLFKEEETEGVVNPWWFNIQFAFLLLFIWLFLFKDYILRLIVISELS